jgi:hypothetical protein
MVFVVYRSLFFVSPDHGDRRLTPTEARQKPKDAVALDIVWKLGPKRPIIAPYWNNQSINQSIIPTRPKQPMTNNSKCIY